MDQSAPAPIYYDSSLGQAVVGNGWQSSGQTTPLPNGATADVGNFTSVTPLSSYGGSSTGSTPTYDPNAPLGSTSNPYSTAQQYFMNQLQPALQGIQQGGADAFQNAQNNLQGNANTLFQGYRSGQQSIDQARENNELNRLSATQDLLSYIRNGLRQGGAQLAANNATDSSAAGALGQAYGLIGAQRARGINNQAAVQGHALDVQQSNLGQSLQDQLGQFHLMRDNLANQIGANVRASLAALNQQAQGLSLPDQINVEQQKQQIVDAGMQQLQNVDQWLQGQIATIQPENQQQVQANAYGLQQAGTAAPNPFNIAPMQQQLVVGPQLDQLPLFTFRKGNTNQ